MKVAYLFHGHARTWESCVDSFFENVYSVAPGDIFIHTWDRVNSRYGSYWNGELGRLTEMREQISSQAVDLNGLRKKYNPKHMVIETDRGIDEVIQDFPELESVSTDLAHLGVSNMFKSQYKVFQQSKNYGVYDRYFSCRMDTFFHNKLDKSELENDGFMMVSGPYSSNSFGTFMLDFFAFGTKNDIEIKSNFHSNIWDYWYSKHPVHQFVIENAVSNYYIDNNIKTMKSNLDFEIKRLF